MRTILIVDDEPTVRYGMRRALERQYRIIEAESVAQAKEVAGQQPFDVMLLDMVMPGEGGIELLRWMHANGRRWPVLVVSALDLARVAVEALKLGAADYIVKGFDVDELRTRVGNLIRLLELDEENKRLTERVAREEARREDELQAARRLQTALLPRTPPADCGLQTAARYVPARELGGDLYEFLRYETGQFAFALGDVSGKGAAAALYGALAIGILRSLAPLKLQPAETLGRLNQLVCMQEVPDRFVTLCFATWDRRRRELRIASAGHPQPLLCRRGRCAKIELAGFPIGIFTEASYEEWSAVLDAGDIVLLYSDGITESFNPDGEQFGVERLSSLVEANASLSASGLADCVLRELDRFAAGTEAADDRTLLVARVA